MTTSEEIRYRQGDVIKLVVKSDRIHLFNPVSGDRLGEKI